MGYHVLRSLEGGGYRIFLDRVVKSNREFGGKTIAFFVAPGVGFGKGATTNSGGPFWELKT